MFVNLPLLSFFVVISFDDVVDVAVIFNVLVGVVFGVIIFVFLSSSTSCHHRRRRRIRSFCRRHVVVVVVVVAVFVEFPTSNFLFW